MKPTSLIIMGLAQASAQTAVYPKTSFKIPVLDLGWANACRGADTLIVTSTPQALTWRFSDFAASYPSTDRDAAPDVSMCVMSNQLGDVPAGWRFAVADVQTSGSGNLTGGAVVTSLWTTLSMDVAYVLNPLQNAVRAWVLKSQSMGSFNIFNTTLVASGQDLNGKFDVKAVSEQPDVTNWSPCWPNFVDRNQFLIQFNHQTHIYMGQVPDAAEPRGNIDPGLQVTLNLKWEACDPAVNKVADWGVGGNMSEGWMPYKKAPSVTVLKY